MDFWPDALCRDLITRRVILVLGSGVSRNAVGQDGVTRPPGWKELLEQALEDCGTTGTRHIKSAIRSNDFLHACEWLKRRLDENWVPFLRNQLVSPRFQPAEIHDLIFRLDQRIVLTPNFDDLYERHARAVTDGQVRVRSFFDDDAYCYLRSDDQFIIKIHGSIEAPNKLIFTREEYAKARVDYHRFYASLEAGLLSHTVLFIGCGIEDPDINLLLENQAFKYPESRPHYMLTSSSISSDLETSLRKSRNLKCLKYSTRSNHEELVIRMRDIVSYLDEMREQGQLSATDEPPAQASR